MPWSVEKQGDEWCVIKDDDGAVEGCHETEEAADAQVAALYAAEEEKADEGVPVEDEPMGDEPPTDPDAEGEGDEEVAIVDLPSTIRQLVVNIQATTEAAASYIKAFRRKPDGEAGFKVAGNHWMAVWSNNFEDRDGELFPESAIDAYVGRVDKGMTPLPELWVWHAGKSTAIGSADWVGRHGHFLMAMGQFYGGAKAQRAKAYYAKHAKDTGISHGFAFPAKKFDGKQYNSFNTFEISLLPRGTEANWYTSLEGVKAMTLDKAKQDYLKEVFGDEHATRILKDWEARGKALEELGVEFKDFAHLNEIAEKQATIATDKAFGDLLSDVLESSAEPILAATEAVKQAKAVNTRVDAFEARIKALEDAIGQRPRASQSPDTVVETSHLSDALQKDLKAQNTERDAFWGLDVVKTP